MRTYNGQAQVAIQLCVVYVWQLVCWAVVATGKDRRDSAEGTRGSEETAAAGAGHATGVSGGAGRETESPTRERENGSPGEGGTQQERAGQRGQPRWMVYREIE